MLVVLLMLMLVLMLLLWLTERCIYPNRRLISWRIPGCAPSLSHATSELNWIGGGEAAVRGSPLPSFLFGFWQGRQ